MMRMIPQFWSSRRLVLILDRATPRVLAISSAGNGFSERKRRAWTWATVRFIPQRVPISPQWRMNFWATGGRSFMACQSFLSRQKLEKELPRAREKFQRAPQKKLRENIVAASGI